MHSVTVCTDYVKLSTSENAVIGLQSLTAILFYVTLIDICFLTFRHTLNPFPYSFVIMVLFSDDLL